MHYSKDDIIRMVEEEDVDFIRLQFTDTFGNLKNMAVTSNQLELVLEVTATHLMVLPSTDLTRKMWTN